MADRLLAERLQPSLLDRLTDDAPRSLAETDSGRMIDIARLRQIIQRDLAWLLNTSNMEAEHDLALFPHVAASVLNYGIPTLSGSSSTRIRVDDIRLALRKAIETYEPRILPQTLEIEMRQDSGSSAVISFDIRGELWAEPVPVDLYLRTALNVTNGEITLTRQG
ncbi:MULTISPECIES: type VI secretion system baseplate subunit TssE [Agrobacterium]|jgi:type VI secretion system protein ImpF|uniref:type VI secretion system baseplate subunit TssE n=1 Tax=Agrobacterium TaxID=357 RepID=UPI0011EFB2E6|nr:MULTISPECIES: type VI secretion system baseplate subunit TssE [Agrobacterium]TZG32233.1 type VI secretion system baseplate subunit TssE [Agrobacterium sp. B1(2019)]